MNILEKFLELTSKTYPHGREHKVYKFLPDNLYIDKWGNLYVEIGENPSCMFCSHLDTYTSYYRYDSFESDVSHKIDGNYVRTDGTTILGADDKAGVTLMLNMMENCIPGLYYFFLGEEIGCLGSKDLARGNPKLEWPNIKKVISFDKRGLTSVATFMRGKRSCSDKFAQNFADQLNRFGFEYRLDPEAGSTDSGSFIDIYPECTNISVGYFNEHTFSEYQDIDHLEKLSKALLEIDWEALPVYRDPSVKEYKEYKKTYQNYANSSIKVY